MKRWEIMVALRYLRARRREMFVSLIALIAGGGVTIGVMVLCIVMSVMTGFEEDLRDRILGFNPQIVLLSHSGTMRDYSKVLDAVRGAPGVDAAAPFVYGQAMVSSDNSVAGAVVMRPSISAASHAWPLANSTRSIWPSLVNQLFRWSRFCGPPASK